MANSSAHCRWSYVVSGVIFLAAATEFYRYSLMLKGPGATRGYAAWLAFGGAPLAVAFLTPLLSIAGCFVAAVDVKKIKNPNERQVISFLAVLAVLLSVLGFAFSTVCA